MNKEVYRFLSVTSIVLLFFISSTYAQMANLKASISQIIENKNAKIGVAITGLSNRTDTLAVNGNEHFPMLSVYKFHLALNVLSKVDDGTFSLDQVIHIKEKELLPNTFSRLKEEHPTGGLDLNLRQLLTYSVSHSDNNACDILFKLVKGTKAVNAWIKEKGVEDVSIVYTEEEMHKDERTYYSNWTTPTAANSLLKIFYDSGIISRTSTDFLWQLMVNTSVGNNRIKGLMAGGEIVGHRPGTAGMNSIGINPGFNDIGIVSLPNGRSFAISVFISDSRESDAENAKIIAEIAKTAVDYFMLKDS